MSSSFHSFLCISAVGSTSHTFHSCHLFSPFLLRPRIHAVMGATYMGSLEISCAAKVLLADKPNSNPSDVGKGMGRKSLTLLYTCGIKLWID